MRTIKSTPPPQREGEREKSISTRGELINLRPLMAFARNRSRASTEILSRAKDKLFQLIRTAIHSILKYRHLRLVSVGTFPFAYNILHSRRCVGKNSLTKVVNFGAVSFDLFSHCAYQSRVRSVLSLLNFLAARTRLLPTFRFCLSRPLHHSRYLLMQLSPLQFSLALLARRDKLDAIACTNHHRPCEK